MAAAATLVVIAALLPAVVPPVVERFVAGKIAAFGLKPQIVRMHLGWRWRNGPGLAGDLSVAVADSPLFLYATFGASACEWSATAEMPETPLSESDPVVAALLARAPLAGVTNLAVSGTLALSARAERTFSRPVPAWSVRAPIRGLSASATFGGRDYALKDLSLAPAASGLADHLDVAPLRLRAKRIDAAGFEMTNLTASVRVDERTLLVTEATAGVCGGTVALYSLVLDPKTLSTGFTLFVDDVDTGLTLAKFKGFRGCASGKLHGKVRLFVKDGGKALRLGDAFLYSTPGETGNIRLDDATPVTDNLALAGLDEATRANVAKALANLDYSALRLNLRRGEDRKATLSVALNGVATRGGTTVPVDLTLNFSGELEQLLNLGLGLSGQQKGKNP